MLNIISELNKNTTVNDLYTHDGVCAWFIEKAFLKLGVNLNRVNISAKPPSTEYTLIVASGLLTKLQKSEEYRKELRQSARVVSSYTVSDLIETRGVDITFVQVKPDSKDAIYVGWGADEEYCYPEKKDNAVFIDSYLTNKKITHDLRKTYLRVLEKLGLNHLQPTMNYGEKRIPWPEYQSLLRRSRFFLQTQFGDYGGMNMWEASRCGVMMVLSHYIYWPRTFEGIEHKIWRNEDELIHILSENTDPQEISQKASVNTWEKVAAKMLVKLEEW